MEQFDAIWVFMEKKNVPQPGVQKLPHLCGYMGD